MTSTALVLVSHAEKNSLLSFMSFSDMYLQNTKSWEQEATSVVLSSRIKNNPNCEFFISAITFLLYCQTNQQFSAVQCRLKEKFGTILFCFLHIVQF